MPVLKLYHHGGTASVPPSTPRQPGRRKAVTGWSESSTRRNTFFLYSIRKGDLTGYGTALTLTIKDCPPTHDDWKKLREAFFKKIRRLGMIRAHWVTEWQRRGVPHLHCAIYFDQPNMGSEAIAAWIKITKEYGATFRSQHSADIYSEKGWFEYLSKHARRGLSHYQRCPENIPQGWQKTGRMWGYLGDWPIDPPYSVDCSIEAFHRYRRLIRGYLVSLARATGKPSRIRWTRRFLSSSDKDLSPVKAINEWVPIKVQLKFCVFLESLGYEIALANK